MIYYDLSDNVLACSTNIGDERLLADVITPAHQAHSISVAVIPDEINATYGVDALITDQPGLRIGVRTADCVPILIYDTSAHAVAAIHSGWKGTVQNIISFVVRRMQAQYGCNPRDMRSVIGPCIHVDAFEVGDEVYDAFIRSGNSEFAKRMTIPGDPQSQLKWHIDLPAICRSQLLSLGVNSVYTSPLCTFLHHDVLYSYRHSKSQDRSHRIITSIMLKL